MALFASSTLAADLFTESFDAQETARVKQTIGAGMTATFVDYSNMTVGATAHAIAEAPRQIGGSTATRGILLKTNYTSATERAINLVALDAVAGNPMSFADNYRLKFDMYLRLSPDVSTGLVNGIPPSATYPGTTEQMLWGVGYNNALTTPMSRSFRSTRGSGMWGWLSTDGGHGSTIGGDASLYSGVTLVSGRNLPTDNAVFFTPAFGADATPQPDSAANQWVQVDITVLGGQVTAFYKASGRTGAKLFENASGSVSGGVMVGYEDPFTGSTSFDPDDQWMLLDNMVVEDITPPTMVVAQTAAPGTYRGTPQSGTFTIQNTRVTGDLHINSVSFNGSASSFSVATPLPLTIAPGATQTLTITFNPPPPNGQKTTAMIINSDDPGQPVYTFSGITARRALQGFLEAHYKLDELSTTETPSPSLVDSTGNEGIAARTVREAPFEYGHPSLLGGVGTSVGVKPVVDQNTGNYFVSPVVHTPTFSVSMWIKYVPIATTTTVTRTIFQRDRDSLAPYDKMYALLLDTGGSSGGRLRFRAGVTNSSDLDIITTGPTVSDDLEAYHIVLTHLDEDGFGNTTATRSRLYVNGEKIGEATATTTVPVKGFDDYPTNSGTQGIFFGTRTIAGFGFNGDMDDIQIYGAEINPHQVASMFTKPGTTAADAEFKILGVTYDELNTSVAVTFTSLPGVNYTLQRSTNLTTWDPAMIDIIGAADAMMTTVNFSDAPPGPQFYRMKVD
jgi:hypothetical protein